MRLGKQIRRGSLCRLSGLLLLDERFDLPFDLVHGFQVGVLLVVHVNNVEAVTALDQVAGAAFGERKRSLLELGDGPSLSNESQRPTILGAAGIVGVFLGQIGKITPCLYLLQDVLGLGAGSILLLGVHFAVGTW